MVKQTTMQIVQTSDRKHNVVTDDNVILFSGTQRQCFVYIGALVSGETHIDAYNYATA